MESDSLIAIQAINEKTIPPRQIWNLIYVINVLAKKTNYIKLCIVGDIQTR